MRLIDTKNLVPYVETALSPEEAQEHIDRLHQRVSAHAGRPVTAEQEDRWVHRSVIWRAENDWLRDNFPVGSVFEHMLVPVMVLGRAPTTPRDGTRFVGPEHAALLCHCAGEGGGLLQLVLTVPQLRAILEPGYVAPARDPLFYGPGADDDRA